jgi:hypothetical protein
VETPIPQAASYTISKGAINMLTVKPALFYTECVVIALDPGIVKTKLNTFASTAPDGVATSVLVLVEKLTKEDSGHFL